MKARRLQQYREQLLKMQRRLGHNRQAHWEEAFQPTGGEASGGISNAPLHPSDLASRQTEEYVTLGLIQNEEGMIEAINEALERIDQGTFGICDACRRPIAAARLAAVPYARWCAPCARRSEGS